MKPLSQHMPEVSPSGLNPSSAAKACSPSEASRAAEILFGCYRTGGAAEPEIFVAGVAAVLSDYPAEVVQAVVDPRNGLPSRTQWLPTIAEVKTACEAAMAPIRRAAQRERIAAESARLLAAPEKPRPTIEELRERFGADWGIERPEKAGRAKTLAELEAEAAELKIEPSDALKEKVAERFASPPDGGNGQP